MMMNCYKIKTERMKRHGWIRWSWITGSRNEQIGLRWNVIHFTRTFAAYLLIKPQSVIRLFCANKHSFNLTQQGIPYIYKGCSWGKCYLFRLLPNSARVKWKSRAGKYSFCYHLMLITMGLMCFFRGEKWKSFGVESTALSFKIQSRE